MVVATGKGVRELRHVPLRCLCLLLKHEDGRRAFHRVGGPRCLLPMLGARESHVVGAVQVRPPPSPLSFAPSPSLSCPSPSLPLPSPPPFLAVTPPLPSAPLPLCSASLPSASLRFPPLPPPSLRCPSLTLGSLLRAAVQALFARATALSPTLCADTLFGGGADLLVQMAAGVLGDLSYLERCVAADLLHFCLSRVR